MRTSTLSLFGVLSTCVVLAATPARADEYQDQHRMLQPQRDDARRLEDAQRREAKRAADDLARRDERLRRWADEERRRSEDVERAKRRLELKQQEWQRWGDRKAYRRLRAATEDVARQQRERDDLIARHRLTWQRENAGRPYPAVALPTPVSPLPGPSFVPGPVLPEPTPSLIPPAPTPALPRPMPRPAPGPELRPPLPAPPEDPVPPAGAQEL
jgi:hypothetical protein